MPVKLCRWGNSHGIRVPAHVLERTGLCAGDFLYIRVADSGEIVIKPVKVRDIPAGFQSLSGSAKPKSEEKEVPW